MMRTLLIGWILCLAVNAVLSEEATKISFWDGLSLFDVFAILGSHNTLRAQEPAGNMRRLRWNNDLADSARTYAELCEWRHGQHPDFDFTGTGYSATGTTAPGQNMFSSTAAGFKGIVSGIRAWYNEKNYTTFLSNGGISCAQGKICGHYTQLTWAKTFEFGCGLKLCPWLTKYKNGTVDVERTQKSNNTYLFVCNYGPRGNYAGSAPYVTGNRCTRCQEGSTFCAEDLCESKDEIDAFGLDYTCQLTCKNCGTLDAEKCKCNCPPGYIGSECQDKCQNYKDQCVKKWPKSACSKDKVKNNCPLMCGTCVAATGDPTC